MLLDNYFQLVDESGELLGEVTAAQDPLDYITNFAYECALTESKINLNAMCLEYSYLRENGGTELTPIQEANVISTIFQAIKNAISTAFKKVCEFFKGLFKKNSDDVKEIKKKSEDVTKPKDTNTAETEKPKEKSDTIDMGGFTYYDYNSALYSGISQLTTELCSELSQISGEIERGYRDAANNIISGDFEKVDQMI